MRCAAVWILVLAAGCESGAAQLAIDVKTDLAPGLDFARVRARLAEPAREGTVDAVPGEPFLDGVRAATFEDVPPGDREVMVELLDQNGGVVISRRVLVTVERTVAVTVILARDCRGVTCPGAGDPNATECLGGRCVSERCLGGEDSCPSPECTSASECPPLSPCATPRCDDGICLYAADDDACASGQRCDPDLGCVAIPLGMDAGAGDAGAMDGGARDAGDLDAGGRDAGDLDGGAATDASFLSCLAGPDPLVLFDARFAEIMGSRNIARLPDLAMRPPDFDVLPMGGSVVINGASASISGNARLESTAVEGRALFDAIQPSSALSIELWMFTTFGGRTGTIASLNGMGAILQNDRQLVFQSGAGSAVADDAVADLNIVHVVGTFEPTATGHKIYVGGAMVQEVDGTGRPAEWVAGEALLMIGGGSASSWSGNVRRVAVYDRALTPTEISCLFRAGYGALP